MTFSGNYLLFTTKYLLAVFVEEMVNVSELHLNSKDDKVETLIYISFHHIIPLISKSLYHFHHGVLLGKKIQMFYQGVQDAKGPRPSNSSTIKF